MGMVSYFESEDIEIINIEGLKKFLELYKKEIPNGIFSDDYGNVEMLRKDDKGKYYFTFQDWDNMKIISYWYDQDVLFLDMLAPYIEGEVRWTFESPDEIGWIKFEGGKCSFELGQMEYQTYKAKQLMTDKNFKIPKALEQLRKNAFLLRKIEDEEK